MPQPAHIQQRVRKAGLVVEKQLEVPICEGKGAFLLSGRLHELTYPRSLSFGNPRPGNPRIKLSFVRSMSVIGGLGLALFHAFGEPLRVPGFGVCPSVQSRLLLHLHSDLHRCPLHFPCFTLKLGKYVGA